jgi:UDP-glucuronate decarboxylase
MKSLVVISGAAGMSGNETVKQLLKRGYYVVGFDNFFASSIESLKDVIEHKSFTFFNYNLCDHDNMGELEAFIKDYMAIREINALSFINYAAVVHTKHFYNPDDTFETNVIGMRSFLDMAIRLNAISFINCSTSEVYSLSSYKEGGVTETDPLSLASAELSMRTSYATGKLMTEFFLRDAVDRNLIKGCSIRFANVYSNDELMPEHIIPFAIDSLSKGNQITLLENARTSYRTFLHNIDSCSSVISLLETSNALNGSIYNVGTEDEILITDLVRMIGKELGHDYVDITFKGSRSADPSRRLLNTNKIKDTTGWFPCVKLNDGIKMCIKFKLKR